MVLITCIYHVCNCVQYIYVATGHVSIHAGIHTLSRIAKTRTQKDRFTMVDVKYSLAGYAAINN